MYEDWTEQDIQSLKAQEAKDVAVELLEALRNKEVGPISPGEVQLRELEYELKLKQAELADEKDRRAHEVQIRELELQLEQQRSKTAESQSRADTVRAELRELAERVRQSEESLSVSLERATREHRLRLEKLEQEHARRKTEMDADLQEMTDRRDQLVTQIEQLGELQVTVENLAETEKSLNEKRTRLQQQQQQLDEELGRLSFERTKQISEVKQSQELELARLRHEHQKEVMRLDREAAEKILSGLNMVAVEASHRENEQAELQRMKDSLSQQSEVNEEAIKDRFRREYNITTAEPIDVTALFYRHQALADDARGLRERIEKLENELKAARDHIQGEPQRIATAVEAARTPIQNIVEPSGKRS